MFPRISIYRSCNIYNNHVIIYESYARSKTTKGVESHRERVCRLPLVHGVHSLEQLQRLVGPAVLHEELGTLRQRAGRHQTENRHDRTDQQVNPPGGVSLVEHVDGQRQRCDDERED